MTDYIVIEKLKERYEKQTTWLTLIITASDWLKHLSEWLNLYDWMNASMWKTV